MVMGRVAYFARVWYGILVCMMTTGTKVWMDAGGLL